MVNFGITGSGSVIVCCLGSRGPQFATFIVKNVITVKGFIVL